ncbi:MAG: ribokinase [Oscillospiraceae bacterium]
MKKILVIGSINMDFVIDVEHMPQKGETVLSDNLSWVPGGKGANQAYAVGKLGGDVTMLGAVGDDAYGKVLLDNLQGVGVHTEYLRVVKGGQTGCAFISVDQNGENSIIVVSGENSKLGTDYIDLHMDLIRRSDIVVFQLEIPVATVVYAAKKAKELGKTVILDPAPARKDLPEELFRYVDMIKPNEVELDTLVGSSGSEFSEEHLRDGADQLLQKGVGCVLVTLGGNGVYLRSKRDEQRFFTHHTAKPVDTTAAGDTFIGGFVAGLASGLDEAEAIAQGQRAAAWSVTKPGAQTSIPHLHELF